MEQMTVDDILKAKGWKLEQLANELGVSISLISKIKNGVSPLTNDVRSRFEEKLPQWKVVDSSIHWKELFQSKCNDNFVLLDIIHSKDAEIKELKEKLEKIKSILAQ